MPQDSLRSKIYKSFLTCNDPKGIVDKSTVRKKKIAPSEMEKRIKSRTGRRNFCEFSDCKLQREQTAIREVVDEFDSSSSSQLMEVSRGAQKLNQTIHSWSNGRKYNTQSEQIARDLFKGALDLQQSLVILGRLQEASRYMTQVTKHERRMTENIGMERTCFNRNEFQKSRLSADYSYGDGSEELKKVVRDRLARQILFPSATNSAERTCFHEISKENSASEIASTSSSQSSMVYNTAANPTKKGNGKNLIAKLMGLELQSKHMHENLHNQFLRQKISDHRRPKSGMEMDETKKQKSVTHKIAKRTSESNLDTKQFKGILKYSTKEVNDYFNYSSYIHSREELTHAAPPIVLLKPLRASQVELEEWQARVFEEGRALDKKKFMKLKMKEKYPQQTNENKVEALSFQKALGSIGAEETALSRINHRKEAQNPKEDHWKPKECISVIKSKKRISHIPLDQNLQRKEAIDKKVLESQKEVTRKNLLSQDKIVPECQDQGQEPPRKFQFKQNATEEFILHDSTPTPDTASEWRQFSMNQGITEKVINEVAVEKSVAINFGGKSEIRKSDQTYSPASLLHMKEKAGGSRPQTCDCCSESQSSLVRPCRTPERSKYVEHEISVTKPGNSLKAPIPSSPPSADHAEELFRLNANGSSRMWISPEEPTPNVCDGMEFWNHRKINEANNGILGLSWWWAARESMKEAEEVVGDLEERILVGLIREIFA